MIRLEMREPESEVERQARSDLPGVLQVPRDVLVKIALNYLDVRLGVGVEDPQKSVGERISAVQRIGTIAREIDIALNVIL